MTNKSLKVLSVLLACAAVGGLTAQAQDKATLDLLVKKGVITQDEADSLAKQAAMPVVKGSQKAAKSISLIGRIQTQYNYIAVEDRMAKDTGRANASSQNGFDIRRLFIGAKADMGNGWSGTVLADLAAGTGRNYIDTATIDKKLEDYGTATAGFRKVNLGLEQNTSDATLPVIERSIASNYFTDNGGGLGMGSGLVGARHLGLFWNGEVKDVEGLGYGVSVNNGPRNFTAATGTGNQLSYYGNIYYGTTVYDVKAKAGINLGFSPEGNSVGTTNAALQATKNAIFVFNPYTTVAYEDFSLYGDVFMADIQNGKYGNNTGAVNTNRFGYNSGRATPVGFHIVPSYKITPEWEVVARYTFINTNGAGITTGVIPGSTGAAGANAAPTNVNGTGAWDKAVSYYGGVNYYIMGDALKVMAGYEMTDFYNRYNNNGSGSFSGQGNGRLVEHAFRARVQVLF